MSIVHGLPSKSLIIFPMESSVFVGMSRDIMAKMEISERVVLTRSKHPPWFNMDASTLAGDQPCCPPSIAVGLLTIATAWAVALGTMGQSSLCSTKALSVSAHKIKLVEHFLKLE
jgi:hypothetical protein